MTTRADLVRAQLAEPATLRAAREGAPPVRAGVTGSGSELLVLTWTAAELARARAAGTRVLGRLGVRAGMRVANALPGGLATPGSLLLGDVVEELGGLDVPLGAIESEAAARAAWELIDRVETHVLVLDAPSASTLFAAAPAGARAWWQGIVWLQGGRAEGRVGPPAGFAGWQRTWLAIPETSCFVAGTCARDRYHVDEDVRAEVVGGRLVLTPVGATDGFVTGRAARLVPCDCGTPGTVVEIT
jgi:hypothetical protein